jgi:hypothetical protein
MATPKRPRPELHSLERRVRRLEQLLHAMTTVVRVESAGGRAAVRELHRRIEAVKGDVRGLARQAKAAADRGDA